MPTQAQARRDSVELVSMPARGETYALPRTAAVHYRNLVLELVPAMEAKIAALETTVSTQTELAANRLRQVENLSQTRDTMTRQIDSLESDLTALRDQFERVDAARKRELRWKKFWKGSSFVAVGAAVVLGVVALGK